MYYGSTVRQNQILFLGWNMALSGRRKNRACSERNGERRAGPKFISHWPFGWIRFTIQGT